MEMTAALFCDSFFCTKIKDNTNIKFDLKIDKK